MNTQPKILDACCGSRMMWFDPQNPLALFADRRAETITERCPNTIDIFGDTP